jgi:hypothetical protein
MFDFTFGLKALLTSAPPARDESVAAAERLAGPEKTSFWGALSAVAGETEEPPRFNVNGTPMVGILDTRGNPYGSTLRRPDEPV